MQYYMQFELNFCLETMYDTLDAAAATRYSCTNNHLKQGSDSNTFFKLRGSVQASTTIRKFSGKQIFWNKKNLFVQ